MDKPHILFLCTGNSIRSQMAEAFCRKFAGDRFEVSSAGVAPGGIHPSTIQVMSEVGIDLSGHRSKSVQDINVASVTYLVTLCGHAKEACPVFLRKVPTEHWPIDDPTAYLGTADEKLQRFRATRDEIRRRVEDLTRRLT